MTDSTSEQRRRYVAQMNAHYASEGIVTDAADRAVQARYIAGDASLHDLLLHACGIAGSDTGSRRQPFVPSVADEQHAARFLAGEMTLAEFLEAPVTMI